MRLAWAAAAFFSGFWDEYDDEYEKSINASWTWAGRGRVCLCFASRYLPRLWNNGKKEGLFSLLGLAEFCKLYIMAPEYPIGTEWTCWT